MTDPLIQDQLVFEDACGIPHKVKNEHDLDAWILVDILTANNKGEEVYETAWLERKLNGAPTFRPAIEASLARVRHLFSDKHNHMVVLWDPDALPSEVAARVIKFMDKQKTPLYGVSAPPDLAQRDLAQRPGQQLPQATWEPAAPAKAPVDKGKTADTPRPPPPQAPYGTSAWRASPSRRANPPRRKAT